LNRADADAKLPAKSDVAIALTITKLSSTPSNGSTINIVGTNITPPPIPKSPDKMPVINPINSNEIITKISIFDSK
jgi:hypothetical protein